MKMQTTLEANHALLEATPLGVAFRDGAPAAAGAVDLHAADSNMLSCFVHLLGALLGIL